MSKSSVLDMAQFKTKKDLEKFTIALFSECLKLRSKIEDLEEKNEHLKNLLDQALLSWDDTVE